MNSTEEFSVSEVASKIKPGRCPRRPQRGCAPLPVPAMGALPRIPSSGVGSTAVTELSEYGKAQRSAAFPEGTPVHFAYSSRAPSRGCASRPSDATGLIARYENSRFRLKKKKKERKWGKRETCRERRRLYIAQLETPKLISLRPFRRGEALPQGGERMGVRGPRGAAMDLPSPHPPRSSAGPLRAQPPLPTPRPPTFRAYRGALRRGAPEERPTPGPGPKGGRPGARCGARLPSQVNAEAEIPFAITFNHNRSFYLRA